MLGEIFDLPQFVFDDQLVIGDVGELVPVRVAPFEMQSIQSHVSERCSQCPALASIRPFEIRTHDFLG